MNANDNIKEFTIILFYYFISSLSLFYQKIGWLIGTVILWSSEAGYSEVNVNWTVNNSWSFLITYSLMKVNNAKINTAKKN